MHRMCVCVHAHQNVCIRHFSILLLLLALWISCVCVSILCPLNNVYASMISVNGHKEQGTTANQNQTHGIFERMSEKSVFASSVFYVHKFVYKLY